MHVKTLCTWDEELYRFADTTVSVDVNAQIHWHFYAWKNDSHSMTLALWTAQTKKNMTSSPKKNKVQTLQKSHLTYPQLCRNSYACFFAEGKTSVSCYSSWHEHVTVPGQRKNKQQAMCIVKGGNMFRPFPPSVSTLPFHWLASHLGFLFKLLTLPFHSGAILLSPS